MEKQFKLNFNGISVINLVLEVNLDLQAVEDYEDDPNDPDSDIDLNDVDDDDEEDEDEDL